MQLHQSGGVIRHEDLRASLNTNGSTFAVVYIERAQLFLQTIEDADELIKVAVEAKRLLVAAQQPETVPWPTGFCGHPVHPGAWALSLHRCRECLEAENAVGAPEPPAVMAGEVERDHRAVSA